MTGHNKDAPDRPKPPPPSNPPSCGCSTDLITVRKSHYDSLVARVKELEQEREETKLQHLADLQELSE